MIKLFCHGDVAQLARAPGSYPGGRGFDPLRRYHIDFYPYFDKGFYFFRY